MVVMVLRQRLVALGGFFDIAGFLVVLLLVGRAIAFGAIPAVAAARVGAVPARLGGGLVAAS